MLFSIVIILLVAGVAYIHYTQGLFSSTISAICAILAAAITLSYHETIIAMLLKGAMANMAQGMVLCAMYAGVYSILRVIADKLLPGNVRYPLMVDKIGSAVMGAIAGVCAAGILAIAAQALPFGPSIAGYARYEVRDRDVVIPGGRGQIDSEVWDEMKEDSLDPAKASSMLFPVDNIMVSMVGHLSTGALSNDRPLAAVHPDWMTELFGQRIGMQAGTKRVAFNSEKLTMVSLKDPGVFEAKSFPQIDGDIDKAREKPLVDAKTPVFKPGPGETLLVVRVELGSDAGDSDNKVRISCGAVRLLGWREEGGTKTYLNYTPVGTLENAHTLLRNRADDFLIVGAGKSADFVFKVSRDDIFPPKDAKIKDGVFVEVKRMARIDLSGETVKGPPGYSKDVEIVRKETEQLKKVPRPTEGGELKATVETVAGPIESINIRVADKLFHKLNPGQYEGDSANVTIGSGGNATVRQKKFQKLVLDGSQALALIDKGDFATDALWVPDGKKMVQVVAKSPARGDSWAWAGALTNFELVDGGGNKFKPNGAVARVKQSSVDHMVANYDAEAEVGSVQQIDGRVSDIWIVFNVPAGTQITGLQYEGKPLADKSVKVP